MCLKSNLTLGLLKAGSHTSGTCVSGQRDQERAPGSNRINLITFSPAFSLMMAQRWRHHWNCIVQFHYCREWGESGTLWVSLEQERRPLGPDSLVNPKEQKNTKKITPLTTPLTGIAWPVHCKMHNGQAQTAMEDLRRPNIKTTIHKNWDGTYILSLTELIIYFNKNQHFCHIFSGTHKLFIQHPKCSRNNPNVLSIQRTRNNTRWRAGGKIKGTQAILNRETLKEFL